MNQSDERAPSEARDALEACAMWLFAGGDRIKAAWDLQPAHVRETYRDHAAATMRDNCEVCGGERGGVRGNENVIDGRRVCDFCHADMLREPAPQPQDERATLVERIERLRGQFRLYMPEGPGIKRAPLLTTDEFRDMDEIFGVALAALSAPAEGSEPVAWMVEVRNSDSEPWGRAWGSPLLFDEPVTEAHRPSSYAQGRVVPLYRRAERAEPAGARSVPPER